MFYLSIISVCLLLAMGFHDVYRKRRNGLPPGPPSMPLIGNFLQLPSRFLHRQIEKWAKQYGPVYSFWVGSQTFVVLSSAEASADVLDRMSAVTSDRPAMIKAREFYFRENSTMFLDRTPLWRAHRRAMHASLNIRAASRFCNMLTHDAALLVLGLLQHPNKPFHEHVHRYSGSVIIRSLYGGPAIPLFGHDPSKRIEQLTDEAMRVSMPRNSVVDALPILKPLIQRVKWLRKSADDWFEEIDKEGQRLYKSSLPTDAWDAATMVHDLNTNGDKYGLSKHDSMWTTLSLFMAGQETTHSALRVFALALLHYPEVAQIAQGQLDAVCGSRPPTFQDRENLPYIDAIVKEVLRWRPGVTLGLPHVVSESFAYRGYVIPKGALIIDNIWLQTREPFVYKDPELFDPTRFLDTSGRLRPPTPETYIGQLGFGHGRRVCPGRDFAMNVMFISCAYLLWAFQFDWPVDENGNNVTCGVDEMVDNNLVITPRPFGVVLKPRFDKLEERLQAVTSEGEVYYDNDD